MAAAVLILVLYTLLVGGQPPVVRAAIFGGLAMFGRQVGRRQQGLNSLALAAALIVRFQNLVGPILIAFIFAYLVQPLADVIHRRLRLPWKLVINLLSSDELYDLESDPGELTNLSRHQAEDQAPAWRPDGGALAFESHRDGNWEIYLLDLTGGTLTRLTDALAYVEADLVATILAPGVGDPGEVARHAGVMAAARQAGRQAVEK